MGVMERKLVLSLAMATILCLQSHAAISSNQLTEPDYVINNGYSEATAEEIMLIKNRTNGKPYEPISDKKHNKFVRFCRNVYGYIDPAQDTDERMHHDVHMSPSVKDL